MGGNPIECDLVHNVGNIFFFGFGFSFFGGRGRMTNATTQLMKWTWGCHHASCDDTALVRGTSQFGEDRWLAQTLFCDKCPSRTYVEIGALDGVKYSNTLLLERQLYWHGVLIEGHPDNAARLFHSRGKSGKNTIFNEAICPYASIITFSGPPSKICAVEDQKKKIGCICKSHESPTSSCLTCDISFDPYRRRS